MKKRLIILITVVSMLAGFSVAAAHPITVSNSPIIVESTVPTNTPQGFIMSDGRICNPRWGC
jgi:hypothetical protein